MIESLGGVTPTWRRDPNLVVCLMALPQMLQFCLAARRFHGEREFLKRMGFLLLQRRSRVEKKEASAHHSAWLVIVRFAGAMYLRRVADY